MIEITDHIEYAVTLERCFYGRELRITPLPETGSVQKAFFEAVHQGVVSRAWAMEREAPARGNG